MDKTFRKIMEGYAEPYIEIRRALNKEYMKASDVMKDLKITRRQLFHWVHMDLKLTQAELRKNAWRRFSILDLFGFKVLTDLRTLNVRLSECKKAIVWLRYNINAKPDFIQLFSDGSPSIFIVDSLRRVKCYYGRDAVDYLKQIIDLNAPALILPIHPLLRSILKRQKSKNFKVEFARDEDGRKHKVIYTIGGKKYKFDVRARIHKALQQLDTKEDSSDSNIKKSQSDNSSNENQ